MRRLASVLTIVLCLLAAACSSDDDPAEARSEGTGADPSVSSDDGAEEPEPGGTLRVGLAVDMAGWNPASDQFNLSGYQVSAAVYDVLVRYDEDLEPRPYLAESIEPNDDFTEWTFTLRPDVVFHDGTPLDADVLALNFQQTKDSPLLGQVFQAVEEIEVVDEHTVTVHMSMPWASFPDTLTAQPGIVAAPSVFEDPTVPVGTGPFRFESWERGSRLTVVKNEDYWRTGYPLLDGIEFRILTDSRSRSDTLRSGDVDLIEAREAGEIKALEEEGDFTVYLDEYGEATEFIALLNTGAEPFDHPAARDAVQYGIDRQSLADTVFAGRFPVADGPFEEDSPWFRDVEFPGYDPERAAEAVATYEEETGEPLKVEMLVSTAPVINEVAALVDQQLGELGIEVEIEAQEATTALVRVLQGDFQMGFSDALFGSGHPDREYTFIHGDNARPAPELATNFTRITNDAIDEGLQAARDTGDREEQADAWGRVQEGLAEERSFVFLTRMKVGSIASEDVKGVYDWTLPDGTPGMPQDQNVVSLYQVWLDR